MEHSFYFFTTLKSFHDFFIQFKYLILENTQLYVSHAE